MRHLGLPALSSIVFGNSVVQRQTEKNNHNDDPNFDCNTEDDAHSEGDLSDDSLVLKTEDLLNKKSRHGCFKHMVLDLSIQ
jgi:hypothetical protein